MNRRFLLAALLFPAALRADISGPPITTNGYRVDISHGPAVGSSEQIAMGGADAARAHSAAGIALNAAAVAVRPGYAKRPWDWDGTLGSRVVSGQDFDNNGSESTVYGTFVVGNAGGLVRHKSWGAGVYGVSQTYDVETGGVVRTIASNTTHLVFGRSTRGGRLAWGAGIRIAEFKITPEGGGSRLLHLSGAGLVGGVQWAPEGPWRFGAAFQGAVNDDPDKSLSGGGSVTVDGLVVPKGVTLPSSLTAGAAYRDGRWRWALDVLLTGKVEEAYGIESFLEQRVQRSGRQPSISPRLGAEYEARPDRLRLRAGTYYEPSRFTGVSGRWHGTAGAEVRLFRLRLFGDHQVSLGWALDASARYMANFVSLGFWH